MRITIITIAGISSRFNEGIPEDKKKLKAIYYEDDYQKTLLYQLLKKSEESDKVILVCGYKADSLQEYLSINTPEFKEKIVTVFNDSYETLGSGYSFYLGLKEAFRYNPTEIVFVEGDLDIDQESFDAVLDAERSVLTYTFEPIYANKAVVLYKDSNQKYHYAFNSNHGMLKIDSDFSCILNSGQMWKFTEIDKLKEAANAFYLKTRDDTNLRIIQNYLDAGVGVDLISLKRWTNCNTRDDYKKIMSYWEE